MANDELKLRILTYIRNYEDQNGYAPSYQEIKMALGIKSTSTVHDYIRRLQADGHVDIKANHSRALTARNHITLHGRSTRRVRVELADGGVLFMDCSLEPTGTDGVAFSLSGVMDATQLKGHVGNIVSFRFEE